MSSLRQLLETVGQPLLECVVPAAGLDEEVGDVLAHDPTDPPDMGKGDLVLAIGIASEDEVVALAHQVKEAGAAGLVLRSHVLSDEQVQSLGEIGVSLLTVPRGASWSHLIAVLQSALRRGGFGPGPDELSSVDRDDIFTLADAIYALVGEPITIEDRLSRVIGYSSAQEEADDARAEAILGRKVPDHWLKVLGERGVFDELARTERAVYVDDIGDEVLPRLAVAIKAGNEILGYLWAACRSKPSAEQISALEGAAKTAALHLLQQRAGSDIERRIEADYVAAALSGGGAARDALIRLGLGEPSLCVIAVSIDSPNEGLSERMPLEVRDIVSAEFETSRIPARAAILGGVVYVLAHAGEGGTLVDITRLAQSSVERIRLRHDAPLLVGIGGPVDAAIDLPRAHQEADAALRVLRAGRWKSPVASIDEVRVQALLLRFGEIASDEQRVYTKKVEPLIRSDEDKSTAYMETLRAYLENAGDITATGKTLNVHPNTVRYRLARIQEMADIDLSSSDDRLALMILGASFPE